MFIPCLTKLKPCYEHQGMIIKSAFFPPSLLVESGLFSCVTSSSAGLGLPNDCQTLRSNKGSVKAFRLPSKKRNKPGEFLFGEHGWMGRGLQNFPLEILRYHRFCCERCTVLYFLFFGGGQGRRQGATVGDPFSATFRDLLCRILR